MDERNDYGGLLKRSSLDETIVGKQVKTLKGSLDRLHEINTTLAELVQMSVVLKDKFMNPTNIPMDKAVGNESLLKKNKHPETIIEMFDDNSINLEFKMNRIMNNLNKVLKMID